MYLIADLRPTKKKSYQILDDKQRVGGGDWQNTLLLNFLVRRATLLSERNYCRVTGGRHG